MHCLCCSDWFLIKECHRNNDCCQYKYKAINIEIYLWKHFVIKCLIHKVLLLIKGKRSDVDKVPLRPKKAKCFDNGRPKKERKTSQNYDSHCGR